MNEKYEGITSVEAAKRLKEFGTNELTGLKKNTIFNILFHQFKNFLVLLLFIAAVISAFAGEVVDAVIVILILCLNVLLGFVQEFKAEHALASLKKMTLANSRVIRDGKEQLIDSRLLVPGDIILLSEGDKIPGDAVVRSCVRFEVNEASLTGESLPVSKSEDSGEHNGVYMGTIVVAGRAVIEVIKTGSRTKFGTLAASLTHIDKTDTPLTHKITKLGMQLTVGTLIVSSVLFLIGIGRGQELIETLLTSISVMVAAIPEGLPAVITITLAVGLQRMAKQKAILRKLSAIEALGSTTIIATDKTGTLTENNMRVMGIWTNEKDYLVPAIKKEIANKTVYELIKCGIICNDAHLSKKENGYEVLGEQTEGSLLVLAKNTEIDPETVRKGGTLVDEFLFDSQKRMMSVVWKEDGHLILYSKGAPERILKHSTHISVNGKTRKLTQKDHAAIEAAIAKDAKNGLRMLALAKRETTKKFTNRADAEKDLTFLGLAAIADPPRKDIAEVLVVTREAGIRTIMITGDNPDTASYIAHEIGLTDSNDCMVTGQQMASMSDEELSVRLTSACIFARATPEEKYRIVTILQKQGHSVTVTGDGVNDALALKKANVGIAMGITGTDVAKEVADMVITDDNFVSIVRAIREGRIIFDNIMKSITYLVACNLGEVLLIFIAVVLGFPVPLLPVQILWINLVTDGLPALSLAFDPGSPAIMKRKPELTTSHLISRKNLPLILEFGGLTAFIPLAFYIITYTTVGLEVARTVAFTSMVITQMFIIFFMRPDQRITSNKLLLVTVSISLAVQYIIITFEPFTTIFHISS